MDSAIVRLREGAERGIGAVLHTFRRFHGYHPVVTDARRPLRARTVRAIARRFEADLESPILARGPHLPNVRQISERVAMGRALWRDLVVGFASQLADL